MDVLPALPIGNMSFTSLFKKATDLLGFTSPERLRPPPLDGEIIYCKNNVCVHPPAALRKEGDHFPGYLNIRSQDDEVLGSTLILTWIPNSTLQRNPRSIENSPRHPGGPPLRISPRRSPRQEYARPGHFTSPGGQSPADALGSPSSVHSDEHGESDAEKSRMDVPRMENGEGQQISGRIVYDQSTDISYVPPGVKDRAPTQINSATNNGSTTPSSESGSPPTERQLYMMLQKNRVQEIKKERNSSNRSVTSIEMEGDNLVVVTEELEEDSIFGDEEEEEEGDRDQGDGDGTQRVSRSHKDSGVGTLTSRDTDYTNSTSSSEYPSPTSEHYHRILGELQQKSGSSTPGNTELPGAATASALTESALQSHTKAEVEKLKESLNLKLDLTANAPDTRLTPDISVTGSPGSVGSGSTSGPDSRPPTPITPPDSLPGSPKSSGRGSPDYESGAENMTFPNNSVTYNKVRTNGGTKKTPKEQVCGVFSVDLGQMRSLRIFYSDDACTSGQLVIASRESQYKILHFHHGGLDRLAEVFADWKFLAKPKDKRKEVDHLSEHFSVIRPYLPKEQSHPEEGAYEVVNEDTWRQHMNDLGQIEDDLNLRKAIFFAGLDRSLRHEMWPFLLHYYPFKSTHEQREQLRNDKYIEYQNIRKRRESMSPDEYQQFWRTVQSTVEKDVVRTDRTHPYFMGDDNPNIEILQNILLNYAVAHPHYGYTQGMSDLLAPVLVEVQHEVDAYWCFEGLMERTIFVSSPKDVDMDRQLLYLRELLRVMQSRFYKHLQKVQDGMELLFCHRWILLCFKREFPEEDALRMWEACWAHYQTDYFHLFLCVAIIGVYGEDVVQQDLPADEMLLHFSSLSMHMSGEVVLRKARAILHQFRTRRKIPCTLEGLCKLCEPGMWDSGHVPSIVCVGNHGDALCPHGGQPKD